MHHPLTRGHPRFLSGACWFGGVRESPTVSAAVVRRVALSILVLVIIIVVVIISAEVGVAVIVLILRQNIGNVSNEETNKLNKQERSYFSADSQYFSHILSATIIIFETFGITMYCFRTSLTYSPSVFSPFQKVRHIPLKIPPVEPFQPSLHPCRQSPVALPPSLPSGGPSEAGVASRTDGR